MTESQFQSKVVKYLHSKKCYVFKTNPGSSAPVGCPDLWAVREGFWLALECKKSGTAEYRPLQKETIKKLDGWSFCRAVYPENWPEVRAELDKIL